MGKMNNTTAQAETVPPLSCTQPSGSAPKGRPLPKTIGEFEVEALLGKGGMGYVYRAFDPQLQRKVAIKTILPTLATDEGIVDRFLREARMVAQLSHDNICHIYAMGRLPENNVPYFVMEFIEGKSLQDLLKAKKSIPFLESARIIKEAAIALKIAFDKGIIHRDIKPANIMLTPDGRVKVTDFGLAKLVEGGQDLTATDVIVGTPHYLSPECAQGEACDHRADIYSLGATFFHMLAGQVPFDGPSALSVLTKHANDPIPPLRDLNNDVPLRVEQIVERMLQKKAEGRFADYETLIAILDELLSTATSANAITQTLVAQPKFEQSPAKSNALALILGFCGLFAFVLYSQTTNKKLPPPATKAPPPVAAKAVEKVEKRAFTAVPATLEEFKNSPLRKEAKGATHLFILLLHLFHSDEERFKEALPLLLPKGEEFSRNTWYHLRRLKSNPHWMRAFLGGTPASDYKVEQLLEPEYDERQTRIGEDRATVFVWSSGRDLPVPVTLRKNKDGHWKVFSWSSLAMGIKPPKSKVNDF